MEAAASPLPALRSDLRLLPGASGRGGEPRWTLHDPLRNRYYRLSRLAVECLRRWSLGRGEAVLTTVAAETTLRPNPEDLAALIAFLDTNQLVRRPPHGTVGRFAAMAAKNRRSWFMWLIHNYLFVRIPLVRPDRFLQAAYPFIAFLYSATVRWLVVGLGLVGIYLTQRQWDHFLATTPDLFTTRGMAVFGATLVTIKIFHELGHAFTAHRFGCRVPTMGLALLVMWPVLYTDASDAWRLTDKRQRLLISAAGLVVELATAMLATFAWAVLSDGPARDAAFFLAAVSLISSLLFNLNIFMRFDGYYLFSDWLEMENLQDRANQLARWRLRKLLFGMSDPVPEETPSGRRRLLILYAWSIWIYRFFLFLGIAVLVYHLFFKILGLILFAVEILWFIVLPIQREMRAWWEFRHRLRLTRNLKTTFLLLCGLLVAAFLPWRSSIALPATLESAHVVMLYPPMAAQVRAIPVAGRGATVQAGETLLELESPELERNLAIRQHELTLAEAVLRRAALSGEKLKEIHVLREAAVQARTAVEATREQLARLRMTAPMAGIFVEWDDRMQTGQWIEKAHRIGRLAQTPASVEMRALVEEAERERIHPGAVGTFIPDQPWLSSLKARVVDVELFDIPLLDPPYLAAPYTGHIPVRNEMTNGAVPKAAVYPVRLKPVGDIPPPAQVTTGIILVETEPMSLVSRLYRMVAALLVRESGL